MRRIVLISTLFVALGFGGVAAWRLSVDALALIIGTLLGVLIMLPLSVVLFWALRNNSANNVDPSNTIAPPPTPPVIIVQPGAQASNGYPPQQQALFPPTSGVPAQSAPRDWNLRVFGEEGWSSVRRASHSIGSPPISIGPSISRL